LPIVEHGEVLSWSVGGTYFRGESSGFGGDLGIYTLSGVVGLNVTVAPQLERREVVTALTIRYF
jgi:ribosomal protein L27